MSIVEKVKYLTQEHEYWVVFLCLVLAAFLLYAGSFGHQWTYDDFPVVINNPDIRSWGDFLKDLYPGRPLRELTYLFDFSLWGEDPGGYHLQNILWHGLCALLIYVLTRELGGEIFVGWMAALLFLAHPVNVEVVANISHRKDSLCLFFILAAVIFYIRIFARRVKTALLLFVCSATLALLSKQNAIVIPCLCVIYEWQFVTPEYRVLLKYPKIIIVATLAALGGFVSWFFFLGGSIAYQKGAVGTLRMRANWDGASDLAGYYLMVFKSWLFMAIKLFWPTDLALEYVYPVPESIMDPWFLAALFVLFCFLFVFYVALKKKEKLLLFALAWFAISWLPVSNLWPLSYFSADRYLYAPSVGFVIFVSCFFHKMLIRKTPCKYVILSLIVGCLILLTVQQNRVWKNSRSLWTQALEVSPESSFALNNMAMLAVDDGNYLKAKEYLITATRNKVNPNSFDNLGWVHEQLGERENAIKNYLHFIRLVRKSHRVEHRSRADFLIKWLAEKYGIDTAASS